MHGNGLVALFILLELERDGNAIGKMEVGRRVGEKLLVFVEPNGFEGEKLGAAFARYGGVFTGLHGEEGTDEKLSDGNVEWGDGDGCHGVED